MIFVVKVTAKGEVTLPAAVLVALDVGPGDRLELDEGADGYLLRPQRADSARPAPLHDKIPRDPGAFDLEEFRSQPHAAKLRD